MRPYIDLLRQCLDIANLKTLHGKKAHCVFGAQMSLDISGYRLPAVTIRDTDPLKAIHELLWAIRGEDSIDSLLSENITRWADRILVGTGIERELNLIERLHTQEGIPYQESHNPERFYSTEEKPDHVYVEAYNLWRPIGLVKRLHNELSALGVPRKALVGGDLLDAPGVHWRKRPVVQTEQSLLCTKAYRYLRASGELPEVTKSFEETFGPGSLDLWVLVNGVEDRLDPNKPEDLFIQKELDRLNYPLTELVTVEAFDQLGRAIALLQASPDHRQPSVYIQTQDDIEALFQFYSRELTQLELVDLIHRSTLIRKADLELFNSHDPVAKEKYLELSTVTLFDWVSENKLPTRGLLCHLYQSTVDLYTDLPMSLTIYSLLTKMVAQVTGMTALQLVWTGVDCYLYQEHLDVVTQDICNDPLPEPKILINPDINDIDSFTIRDFTVVDYQHS